MCWFIQKSSCSSDFMHTKILEAFAVNTVQLVSPTETMMPYLDIPLRAQL